jgi:hypothetical protein
LDREFVSDFSDEEGISDIEEKPIAIGSDHSSESDSEDERPRKKTKGSCKLMELTLKLNMNKNWNYNNSTTFNLKTSNTLFYFVESFKRLPMKIDEFVFKILYAVY